MRTGLLRVGVSGCAAAFAAWALVFDAAVDAQTQTPRLVRQQHINNPGGPFCSEVGNGRFGFSLALGDMNGDGRDDLLIASNGASSVYTRRAFVFYSTGTGFGTQPVEIDIPANGVGVMDVNGDGIKDAIVIAHGDTIAAFHGRREGFPQS